MYNIFSPVCDLLTAGLSPEWEYLQIHIAFYEFYWYWYCIFLLPSKCQTINNTQNPAGYNPQALFSCHIYGIRCRRALIFEFDLHVIKYTSVWSAMMKAGKIAASLSWQVTDNSKSFIWQKLTSYMTDCLVCQSAQFFASSRRSQSSDPCYYTWYMYTGHILKPFAYLQYFLTFLWFQLLVRLQLHSLLILIA